MLFKRSNSKFWWCSFTAPDGRRIQQSTKTVDKKQAQEFADNLKVRHWRIQKLGEKPRRTWKEAAVRWFKETNRKSTVNDKGHLQWLDNYLGKLYLDEINRDLIDRIKYDKLKTGVQPATVNRLLEVVRVILNTAVKEWEWIDHAPVVKLLRLPNRRIRWLTKEEANRLIEFLPDHLKVLVRFSLATGLRKSNATGLKWSQVDLQRRMAWIHGDQSKTGKPIGVPLNREAVVLLRSQIGKHPTHCFTYKGNPINQVNTKAWKKALAKAGIKDFRWHDLRHTWASWHVQGGTPIHVLQELGGWSEIKMVQRYAHLSTEHLSTYADRLCALENVATFSTTQGSETKKQLHH
ncbi:MAG: integrase [Gammaproteobacteria bacterium]|nr:integrase [Gammaproteobacteria bacterium]|tara:strand:+ start:260 stop:1306 length:1047 start_codon:yes stop_codon:yes gene_type:complete